MGEIADSIVAGEVCEGCCMPMEDGEASGFPRRCAECTKCGDWDSPTPPAKGEKMSCPFCGKRVKPLGFSNHYRDVHL